jgi:predicted esterase
MGETYEFAETVFAGDRSGKQTSTIVFLHGLGDTGHGWADNLNSLGESLHPSSLMCSVSTPTPSSLY